MNPARRALLGLLGTIFLILGTRETANAADDTGDAYLTLSADRVAIDLDFVPSPDPSVSTVDTEVRDLSLVVDSVPRQLDVVGSESPLEPGGTIKLHLAAGLTTAPSHRLIFRDRHVHRMIVRPGTATVSREVDDAGSIELAYFSGPAAMPQSTRSPLAPTVVGTIVAGLLFAVSGIALARFLGRRRHRILAMVLGSAAVVTALGLGFAVPFWGG
jgi:hypothetical protein